MTELEKYYLDKERKTAITKQAEEKAKVSIYNRIISETKPYILTEYKKNPPEYYSWLNVNGKKTLVWRFDGYIRRGR
ncbi:MAG TPA: hypothetical protein PLJ83_10550, partial [Spirochaetales bacterium]|nr:hypothetical protein [Spirochaetales bacterium]